MKVHDRMIANDQNILRSRMLTMLSIVQLCGMLIIASTYPTQLFAQPAQQATPLGVNTNADRDTIEELITKLSSPNFATRDLAKQRLSTMGKAAIPSLAVAMQKANTDLSAQILSLLGEYALDVRSEETTLVIQILKELSADAGTAKANLAKQLLESIQQMHGEYAAAELQKLGARITVGPFALNGRSATLGRQYVYLEIDGTFSGTAQDMAWLPWLSEVELIVMRDEKIDGEWIKYLRDMPSLRNIYLRNTNVRSPDLVALKGIEQINHLEILYTPIDDSAQNALLDLPLTESVRIFGTDMTPNVAEQMAAQLEGIEFQFGAGGFLGISSMITAARSSTIDSITPGGAAEQAGLMPLDVITAIDGVPVKAFEDIRTNLRKHRAGAKVKVSIERPTPIGKPELLEVTVTLGEQAT